MVKTTLFSFLTFGKRLEPVGTQTFMTSTSTQFDNIIGSLAKEEWPDPVPLSFDAETDIYSCREFKFSRDEYHKVFDNPSLYINITKKQNSMAEYYLYHSGLHDIMVILRKTMKKGEENYCFWRVFDSYE